MCKIQFCPYNVRLDIMKLMIERIYYGRNGDDVDICVKFR